MPVINPNLKFLQASCFKEGKRGVLLEGSSRSGKTTASIHFILLLASHYETSATINIIRETYNSFKTTLYDDFNRVMPQFGLSSPFAERQELKTFFLFGNKINLLGSDSESLAHGVSCDYFFMNEALEVGEGVFDQSEMRCRKFWWGDYNPKFTQHYLFNKVLSRPDIGFLKTTFKDNPFISKPERAKIYSYQPMSMFSRIMTDNITLKELMTYDIQKNPRKFNKHELDEYLRCRLNEETGTANEYNWKVYGLGERAAPEGLIFPNVNWVKEIPKQIERRYYGLDFGYTQSPSALTEVAIESGKSRDRMYVESLIYQPTDNPDLLAELIERKIGKDKVIWADPSGETGGKGMISALRRKGFQIFAATTFPGSIKYGISLINKYSLFLVDSPQLRREQSGYVRSSVRQGGHKIVLDDPIDDFNHIWDGVRMVAIMNRL